MKRTPRVSIGLPVYNGERYVAQALDSLAQQTYGDWELVISDNASTDATEDICRRYASRDDRIRYVRQPRNLGAAANFNLITEMASGAYFKWAAHDDMCAPRLLAQCVRVLDADPSVVLCYARTAEIDAQGRWLRELPAKPGLAAPTPHRRFFECVCVPHAQVAVFGVTRREVLTRTRLIGGYASSDRVLLGELALRGRLYEVPEVLFFRRDHAEQSYRQFRSRHEYQAWFDPRRRGVRTFPHWRLLREHLHSVRRVPMAWRERVACYACLAWWVRRHWRYLAGNLLLTEPGAGRGRTASGDGGRPGSRSERLEERRSRS